MALQNYSLAEVSWNVLYHEDTQNTLTKKREPKQCPGGTVLENGVPSTKTVLCCKWWPKWHLPFLTKMIILKKSRLDFQLLNLTEKPTFPINPHPAVKKITP